PSVRRGDEHHAFPKRERLEDQRMGYQFPSFSAYGELLRWNSKRPEMRPTIDGGHLRKQPPLAMADHNHLFESRIFSLRVELCHGFCQSLPQKHPRIGDGISRVVHEKPDFVVRPEPRIIFQLVNHLRPPRRTRGRAVHEHDRDASGTMRVKHEKSFELFVTDSEITGSKTRDLKVPNRRSFQSQGKGGSCFEFDGDIGAVDLDRSGRIWGIEFQLAL